MSIPICERLQKLDAFLDSNNRKATIEAAAIIRDLVEALGVCVAVAERPLKNAMNLKGESPYDIAMAALSHAQVQPGDVK